MKITVFIFGLFLYSLAQAQEKNCAQETLIINGEISKYAKEFRESYLGNSENHPIDKIEAIEIAQNSVPDVQSWNQEITWGAVNIDNYWVVRFEHCHTPFTKGGAGMLLVSSRERKVVKYLGEI